MKTTEIRVWHGFGEISASVSHDGDDGNASVTSIDLGFGESQLPLVHLIENDYGVRSMSLRLNGSCERAGLAQVLGRVALELDKPADQLGQQFDFGYDESEESAAAVKGTQGEKALNDWFQSIGISYLYINQSPDMFAKLFKGDLKRPDFLVLLEAVGMIAVDAKNYKAYNGTYSLSFEKELRRVLAFERIFRIPVWYAYLGEESGGPQVWYWISALKALEVGEVKKSKTGEEFLSLKHIHFEQIVTGEELGKLYTHRLPSLKKIAREL